MSRLIHGFWATTRKELLIGEVSLPRRLGSDGRPGGSTAPPARCRSSAKTRWDWRGRRLESAAEVAGSHGEGLVRAQTEVSDCLLQVSVPSSHKIETTRCANHSGTHGSDLSRTGHAASARFTSRPECIPFATAPSTLACTAAPVPIPPNLPTGWRSGKQPLEPIAAPSSCTRPPSVGSFIGDKGYNLTGPSQSARMPMRGAAKGGS